MKVIIPRVFAGNLLFDVVNQTSSLLSQAKGMQVTKVQALAGV
jgi:hypothetical protein